MNQTKTLTGLICLAAFAFSTASAQAYMCPEKGRFIQRDPISQNQPGGGYQDGMSGYQYELSAPTTGRDSYGLALCMGPTNTKAERDYLMRYLQILADGKAKLLAPREIYHGSQKKEACCVSLESASTAHARLIQAIVKEPRVVFLDVGTPDYYTEGNDGLVRVQFLGQNKKMVWGSEDRAKNPEDRNVKEFPFPNNNKEKAVVLAHELIHAYYDRLKATRGYGGWFRHKWEDHLWVEKHNRKMQKVGVRLSPNQ